MRGGAMREQCDAGMRAACVRTCDAKCHGTERYGTERKSIQDPASNRPVPNAAGAVDNPKFVRFLELDDAGWSGRQIAKSVGVNERTVCRWRAATGRTKREAPATHPMSDRERAAAMIADGAPFQETAAAVGVTYATLRRWFPTAQAWTKSQAGQYGQMSRRLTALANRPGMANHQKETA